MVNYCIDTSGKRIRPALVFLSGWKGPERSSPDLVRAAAVVELVHLATLVHDDIMDSAEVRRSRRTAMREFGPTAAVLLGDALFAHALHLATHFPTTEVCAAVSESTRRVCAGEIVQSLRRRLDRPDAGRVPADNRPEDGRALPRFLLPRRRGWPAPRTATWTHSTDFGRHLGIAYQIYDDLADFFGREEKIGKTLGTDLASGKLTLPLFALMDRLPPFERAALSGEIGGPAAVPARAPPQADARPRRLRRGRGGGPRRGLRGARRPRRMARPLADAPPSCAGRRPSRAGRRAPARRVNGGSWRPGPRPAERFDLPRRGAGTCLSSPHERQQGPREDARGVAGAQARGGCRPGRRRGRCRPATWPRSTA